MISCPKCGSDMPELRKTKYGYDFCVSCSETYDLVGKKRGVSVQMGEGDHTWIETVIMNEKEYLEYEKREMLNSSKNTSKSDILNLEEAIKKE